MQKLEADLGRWFNFVYFLCRTLAEMAAATSVHVVAVIEPIIQHANWFFPEGDCRSNFVDTLIHNSSINSLSLLFIFEVFIAVKYT